MSKAKLLVEKKNSSGVVTERFPAKIITAHVKNDGDRAVDSAEFLIPMSSEANEGDTVRYIQDDVDTTSLIGLWNFNGSSRDESGYNNDGNDGTHTAQMNREDSVTSEEYTKDNKVGADFQNGTDVITIPNKTHLVTGTPNVLNFSGMFDIFLRFRYSDGVDTKQIVFSKRSATTGIEIGYDASHHVIVEITSSSSTTTVTGTTSVENTMHLVRVRRNAAGLIQLFINGVEEGTAITNTTDLTVTGNGFFGADYLGSNDTNDLFLTMIRIYKDNLSDADADILLNHFRHAFTMKFEGTVWKIEDKIKNKRIHCKGINKLLPETILNKAILDSRDKSSTSNGSDNIFMSLGVSEVLQQILDEIDSEYLVVDHDNSPNSIGNFIAYGNLLSNLQIMLLVQNNQFYTLPRKVIMLDPINTTTNYIFVHGKGVEISSSGVDDSTVLNDITLKTTDTFRTRTESPSETGTRNYVLTKEPAVITRVLDGTTIINYLASGSGSPSYTYDHFTKTVNLTSAASGTVSIEFTYSDSSLYLAPNTDPASIAKYGRKSKQISPMGIQGSSNFGLLLTNFKNDNKEANERISIRAPLLLNSIRINHEIQVKNDIKGINITTGQSNPSIQIKSIEWFYPEGRTIINAGEHKFDSFDIDKFTAAQVRQVTEDSNVSKTL
jgi:hypothetical protein